MQVTVVSEMYDFSPFVQSFDEKIIQPAIDQFFKYLNLFGITAILLLSFLLYFVIKKIITDPIRKLNRKIKNNKLNKGEELERNKRQSLQF